MPRHQDTRQYFCITKPEWSIFTSINHYHIMSPYYISIITVVKKIHQPQLCRAHRINLLESFAKREGALFCRTANRASSSESFFWWQMVGRAKRVRESTLPTCFFLLGKAKQKTFDWWRHKKQGEGFYGKHGRNLEKRSRCQYHCCDSGAANRLSDWSVCL